MAYKAEIQIVTKGQAQITQAHKALRQLATQVEHLASGPGSLSDFNKVLSKSKSLLSAVQQGTVEEKKAVEQYVTALSNANAAQKRQNKLIDEEIRKRGLATSELKKYNAAATPPRSRTSMTAAYMNPAAAIRARRLDAEIEKRGGAAGIAATATSNVKKSQNIRKLRSDTQALNKALSNRLRLERKLAERGLMQLRSGKVVKGIANAGFGVQGPAPVSASQRKAEEALATSINKTVKANIKKSQTVRKVRADTQALNKALNNQLRLERQLAKRGLMQLSSGKIAKGTDAGFGVQGPAMAGPNLGQRIGQSTLGRAGRGLGRFAGRVAPGAVLGAAFPLITGGDPTAAIGGGIGGLVGGALGGPMGAFAGSLVGQLIGERIAEAKKLTEEAKKYKQQTKEIEVIETRILALSQKAVKERRKGNEEGAIKLESAAERARIAFDQFKKMTELENDERNKTKAGKRLTDEMKKRVLLEARREVALNKEVTLLKLKDALLDKELQKESFLAQLSQKRVDIAAAEADGSFKVQSAKFSSLLQINTLEMQRAKNNKKIKLQFDLQLKRAELIYQQTLLQVRQERIRVNLARTRAAIELNRLKIELNKTAEAGKDVTLAKQSVELQKQSLRLADLNVRAAAEAAQFQIRGAQAVRVATIEQVRYGRQRASQGALNNVRQFARGGYVDRPTNAVIGEAGESEYVIPSSKMNSAMQRYSSGIRGEAITAGAVTGGSTTNSTYSSQQNSYYGGGAASVNITTGPVIRMGNNDYVSMSDLQRGMSTAANAGQENMMRSMRRSYGARRSMGA